MTFAATPYANLSPPELNGFIQHLDPFMAHARLSSTKEHFLDYLFDRTSSNENAIAIMQTVMQKITDYKHPLPIYLPKEQQDLLSTSEIFSKHESKPLTYIINIYLIIK
jgi:hypothetical protein